MSQEIPFSTELQDRLKNFKTEPISETIYPAVVVASFDILGFGALLRTTDGTKKAIKVLKNFYQNASVTIGLSETKPTVQELGWRIERYSDSIFMYGNPNESLSTQLQNISLLAAKTIAVGFKASLPYPVRCGIGVGDLAEISITTFKGNITYFTGSSILKAYELEKCQKWAGGSVHRELNDHIDKYAYVKKCRVPFKQESHGDYAVDWVTPLLDSEPKLENPLSSIKAAFEGTHITSDVTEKKQNT